MTSAATTGRFAALATDEPFPGVRRSSFSTSQATVAHYVFEAGASFPLHSHPQEQITLIEEGEVAMTTGGETHRLTVGEWSVVEPEVEHGIRAGPAGARIVAIVVPRRERPDDYAVAGQRAAGSPAGVIVLGAGSGPLLGIVERGGSARAIVWPGMGATRRSMHRIALDPRGTTRPLTHASEAVYYVADGDGEVRDESDGAAEPLIAGSMVHVDPGTAYRFVAGSRGMGLVGGPAPADAALYDSLEAGG